MSQSPTPTPQLNGDAASEATPLDRELSALAVSMHTPEPWVAAKARTLIHIRGDDSSVCEISVSANHIHEDYPGCRALYIMGQEANAARIVACVNACKGINPEAVKDLLTALQAVKEWDDDSFADIGPFDNPRSEYRCLYCSGHDAHDDGCPIPEVRAAIAKATGGAA